MVRRRRHANADPDIRYVLWADEVIATHGLADHTARYYVWQVARTGIGGRGGASLGLFIIAARLFCRARGT